MKVLCVFGTRPEAIKMAPVVKELRKFPDRFVVKVCVTAQHREMLDQVLRLFDIHPDFDLDIMRENQSLTKVTSEVLTRLEPIVVAEKPEWVLIQGDTTTVMAAALVAFYHRVKIGHVEAGLRTWNKFHPFPEEINRTIVDRVADLYFAPTETARQNLLREGADETKIIVTGNTVIDALLEVAPRPYRWDGGPLAAVPQQGRLILVTAHRRENFGDPMRNIATALREIAARYRDVPIVFPIHSNPLVRRIVRKELGDVANIYLLEPLDYLSLVQVMKRAYLVLTDSGGLQEEAPYLGKPVLVLRGVTERPEAVVAGTVKVIGTESAAIVRETIRLLEDRAEYERMARAVNPYGAGHASERIVAAMSDEMRSPLNVT